MKFCQRFFFKTFLTSNNDAYQHFPKQQILDSSKLKDSAEDDLKSDENGRKFSKRLKNTLGKGDIVLFFFSNLAFSQCLP